MSAGVSRWFLEYLSTTAVLSGMTSVPVTGSIYTNTTRQNAHLGEYNRENAQTCIEDQNKDLALGWVYCGSRVIVLQVCVYQDTVGPSVQKVPFETFLNYSTVGPKIFKKILLGNILVPLHVQEVDPFL